MRVKDIMSTSVEAIAPDEAAEIAWNRMHLQGIHHLIVMEGRNVVGILSQRDLGGSKGEAVRKNHFVADLMTDHVIVATPTTTIREAANLLRGNTIGCLPVMDGDRLVGVVTISDLLEMAGRGLERASIYSERQTVRGIPPYRRPGRPSIS